MQPTISRLEQMYDELQDWALEFDQLLAELAAAFREVDIKSPQLVDIGFLLRRMQHRLDESRKQAKAHQETCSKRVCRKVLAHTLQFPSAPQVAHGTLATAIPDIKPEPRIPKHGTPEWEELCKYFQVPQEARALIDFSWKRTGSWLLQHFENGTNPPMTITKAGAMSFKVVYRKKSNGKTRTEDSDE